ncbi:MAG: Trigger factor [Acidimicrobiales bacterium]|nr:Trigger factor [Acidimicrobiales bacterium]
MKTSVEPLEGNKVKLSVEVEEAEFDKAIEAAFRRIAREVRIPGFRPGKAPRRLLEARLGSDAARQEALREALPDYYVAALKEHDVDAIAPPEIDITAGEADGPVVFDAVVEVRPQVSVAGYGGLRVTVPSPEVTDEEVDAQIDRLREQFGTLDPVERTAREGDYVSIDIKGSQDGEPLEGLTADDYLYEVGRGAITPALDEQLRGAKAGDILAFDAEVGGFDEGPQDVHFTVLVKEVREKSLPEPDDEWAAEASEFETVAELRDDIRTRLGMVKKVQATMAMQEQTVDALVELVEEDVPEALVASEVERRIHDLGHRLEHQGADLAQYLEATGRTQDDLLAELREQGARAVKADLALRAVAESEGIEATDEDVDKEVGQLADRAGVKTARLLRELDRNDQLPAVRSDIRKSKALAWLIDNVEVVDPEGRAIDRSELQPPPLDTTLSETSETTESDTHDHTEVEASEEMAE